MKWAGLLLLVAGPAAAQGAGVGLENQGVLVGTVCADLDRDGVCGANEVGVAGVRVMLETGLTAVTDRNGRFHLANISSRAADALAGGRLTPGRHRVRVDTRYLPRGTGISPDGVTVEIPMGGIAQVEFALAAPEKTPALLPGGDAPRAELGVEAIRYRVTGAVAEGSVVEVSGQRAEVDAGGRWAAWVNLARGPNTVAIAVRTAAGDVAFFERGYEVVRRPNGALVIPRGEREGARVQLPSVGLAGATAMVSAPVGTRLSIDGREVGLDGEGRATVALAVPPEGGYRLVSTAPGRPGIETRAEAPSAIAVTAVALLDLEFTLDPERLGPRLFGRGAGAVRVRAWGFDLGADLDLRDSDFQAAMVGGAGALISARRLDVFERQSDALRTPLAFGDDSATLEPNPSESRLRVEVARAGIGKVGWGSTRAWLGDSEVGRYHRGLTGAFADVHLGKPEALVEGGVKGWYAPTDGDAVLGLRRLPAHDQFQSTGGSIYWLSHGGLVAGSELVRIEFRDGVTGFPSSERHLTRGRDYAIDAVSGRVMLAEPLAMFGARSLLMTDALGAASAPTLVVDYEYLSASGSSAQLAGGSGELRIGPVKVSAGGAWEQGSYGLVRARAVAPIGPVTLLGEVAHSSGTASGFAISDDGGLGFQAAPDSVGLAVREGWAFGARARGKGLFGKGEFDLAWRRRNAGFSDAQHSDAALFQQFSGRVDQPIGPVEIVALFDDLTRADARDPFGPTPMHGRVAGGGFGIVQPRWGARLEARDVQVDLERTGESGGRLGVGAGGHFDVTDWLTLVAGYRQRVWARGDGPGAMDDSFGQVGADVKVSDTAQFGVRGGWGPGFGPQVWGTAQVKTGEDTWYGGHALDVDGPSAGDHRYVSGVRRELSDGAAVFVEDVAAHDTESVRVGRAMGLSQDLPFGLKVGARYERGWKEGFESAQAQVRDVGGVSVAWTSARARLFARGEVRSDRGGPAGSGELLQAFAMAGGEVELPAGLGATARFQWQHTSRDGLLVSRLIEGAAAVTWRHRLATVVLRYSMQRELLPPPRGITAERGFQLLSLLPTLRLHDRLTVGAGLHASFGMVPGDTELVFAASLRPAVRIWKGIEVAGEVVRRSQASDGGGLTSVRGEAGYRFAENFFLGAGYTFFGFNGLGLNDGSPETRSRLYLRAEAAW